MYMEPRSVEKEVRKDKQSWDEPCISKYTEQENQSK